MNTKQKIIAQIPQISTLSILARALVLAVMLWVAYAEVLPPTDFWRITVWMGIAAASANTLVTLYLACMFSHMRRTLDKNLYERQIDGTE